MKRTSGTVSVCLGALALALAAGACGGDEDGHACGKVENCGADQLEYTAGMIVQGADGNLGAKLISSTPAPPEVLSEFVVSVVDSGGSDVAGGTVTKATSWSVDCMHGGLDGDEGPTVTDNGDDTFTFTPDYAHGGPWDVILSVTDGTNTDTVTISFCLPSTGDHEH